MCALRNTRRRVYLITADLLSATPYCFEVHEQIKKDDVAVCLHPKDDERHHDAIPPPFPPVSL